MTAMTFGIGHRQGRSLRLGAVAGVVAAVAVLLVVALLASGTSSHSAAPKPDASALVVWEAAVQPLVTSGGQVVALGPRTAVAQLAQHKVTDAAMKDMASGWVRRLSQLDGQIAAVPTPDFLRPSHALLGSAMDGYVTASRDVLAATAATGARRDQLLRDASAAGKAADHDYDRATAAIAALRAQLSLPTDWSG